MTPEDLHFNRIQAFGELAERELEAARLLAPKFRGQAAYFLQQCVEKLLRGLLEIERIQAGPTHDIDRLSSLLPAGNEFFPRFQQLHVLSSAATRYRYPGGHGEVRTIRQEELERLVVLVERIFAEVYPIIRNHREASR